MSDNHNTFVNLRNENHQNFDLDKLHRTKKKKKKKKKNTNQNASLESVLGITKPLKTQQNDKTEY